MKKFNLKYFLVIISMILIPVSLSGCSFQNESINKNTEEDILYNQQLENIFNKPFSKSSVWNREIPNNANYRDVQDAIWGDPAEAPTYFFPDFLTVAYVDESQPLVDFRLNKNWPYPFRSRPKLFGVVLFQRRMSPNAATEIRYPNNGNAIYAIIDPETGTADEGNGAWREPNGDFLTYFDTPSVHNIDVVNGDGISGGHASGLSTLGGAIRLGEINTTINHALSTGLSPLRYSKNNYYVWPASAGDNFAPQGYLGDNPYYTMGTLLAIPKNFDLVSVTWNTNQGLVVAKAVQKYGMYITESASGLTGGNGFYLTFEHNAITTDFGVTIDPDTNEMNADPSLIDVDGFTSDMVQIMSLVYAVINKQKTLRELPKITNNK